MIPSGQVTGSLPADEVLAERVDKLLDAVRAEVVLEDTDHPLFHGSWDWHSSVHAHWALLALGALRGRRSETQWVIERMRSDAWRAEIEHLQAHPDFELPYGRAWLLALAHDYERLSGDRGLRQTLEPVASALFDWCKSTSLGPQTQEYQNPCWPLLHLWRWSQDEPHVRGALTQLIGERFTGRELSLSSDAEMPGAFFSRWALQAHLLEGTIGPRALAGWLGGQALDPTQIEALTDLHSSHHLGTNATRAWGFWSCYRATGDDDWRDAFTRHLSASIDLHDSWCHDRRAYGHWVPQFTLYAIHLATEDSADANGDALR